MAFEDACHQRPPPQSPRSTTRYLPHTRPKAPSQAHLRTLPLFPGRKRDDCLPFPRSPRTRRPTHRPPSKAPSSNCIFGLCCAGVGGERLVWMGPISPNITPTETPVVSRPITPPPPRRSFLDGLLAEAGNAFCRQKYPKSCGALRNN